MRATYLFDNEMNKYQAVPCSIVKKERQEDMNLIKDNWCYSYQP